MIYRNSEIVFRKNETVFRKNEIVFRKYEMVFRKNEITWEICIYKKSWACHFRGFVCFRCNIAIKDFFVLHTCEVRFYDVIDRTVHIYIVTSSNAKFQNMADLHGDMSMFWTLIF